MESFQSNNNNNLESSDQNVRHVLAKVFKSIYYSSCKAKHYVVFPRLLIITFIEPFLQIIANEQLNINFIQTLHRSCK